MLREPMEKFGHYERGYTQKQKEEIGHFLRTDYHVLPAYTQMVFEADKETEYFDKASYVFTAISFPWFMRWPIINTLPPKSRIFWSAAASLSLFYFPLQKLREELWWHQTYAAFQKHQVYNNENHKVTI